VVGKKRRKKVEEQWTRSVEVLKEVELAEVVV